MASFVSFYTLLTNIDSGRYPFIILNDIHISPYPILNEELLSGVSINVCSFNKFELLLNSRVNANN